ncbi:MAG: hypothetical protein JW889_12660 [Verrucomicrobia bacterium]|nr:hypothetical protein [Verrucomicrobiota bacterium]
MWSRLVRVGLLAVVVLVTPACAALVRRAAAFSPLLAHGEGGEDGLVEMLGEQHVAVIHFPIALTIAAALAELLALITRRPAFTHAARFCIVIAALGAIAAVITGWIAFGEETEGMTAAAMKSNPLTRNLLIHRSLGIAAAIVIVAGAVLSEVGHIGRNKWVMLASRIALLAAVVLVVLTGYYGGKYVFPEMPPA